MTTLAAHWEDTLVGRLSPAGGTTGRGKSQAIQAVTC
jgi:hypothetical protein